MTAAHERYEAAFAGPDAPFAFVDIDAAAANGREMLARAGTKPILIPGRAICSGAQRCSPDQSVQRSATRAFG